ncbi:hypothetical protein [Mycoplasma seminis]|uniref:Lipoprotein n=1 Tax=Mycoplasma seminis TaxID=512749 RepID=A0ABY9HAJ7_9MOLU|nr:hypothetical protein [Mycoplasma seminis]WLP85629.1 hypothetical protein Q8852_00490 [Mycoplasma seminis]
MKNKFLILSTLSSVLIPAFVVSCNTNSQKDKKLNKEEINKNIEKFNTLVSNTIDSFNLNLYKYVISNEGKDGKKLNDTEISQVITEFKKQLKVFSKLINELEKNQINNTASIDAIIAKMKESNAFFKNVIFDNQNEELVWSISKEKLDKHNFSFVSNDKLTKAFNDSKENIQFFWLQKSLKHLNHDENDWMSYFNGTYNQEIQKNIAKTNSDLGILFLDKVLMDIYAAYSMIFTFKLENRTNLLLQESLNKDDVLLEGPFSIKIPSTLLFYLSLNLPTLNHKNKNLNKELIETLEADIYNIGYKINPFSNKISATASELYNKNIIINKHEYLGNFSRKNENILHEEYKNELLKYRDIFMNNLISINGLQNTYQNIIQAIVKDLKELRNNISVQTPLIKTFDKDMFEKNDDERDKFEKYQVEMTKELIDVIIQNLANDLKVLS